LGDKEIETLNLKHIATLYLSGNPITINSLEYLSRFPSIRHLHLRGCVGVNDKCFLPLSKLNLITLSLAATNVSTLEGLDKLRTVQSLFLEECMKLNDLSLEQLVALRLRTLNLSGTNITDQGLKTIAKLKPKTATVDVSLKGCPNITVAGRTYLKQHANIEIAEDDYGLD
jgi:Leucine-rich repeat (LRR) protein